MKKRKKVICKLLTLLSIYSLFCVPQCTCQTLCWVLKQEKTLFGKWNGKDGFPRHFNAKINKTHEQFLEEKKEFERNIGFLSQKLYRGHFY